MLKVGRSYHTIDGKAKFHIIAKKNKPASNGCNFLGENLKTGVVTYFNHKGHHAFSEYLHLKVDPYTWIGLVGGRLATDEFQERKNLKYEYPYYLRMENNDPSSIICVMHSKFLEDSYA
jgi:hypothetical protein